MRMKAIASPTFEVSGPLRRKTNWSSAFGFSASARSILIVLRLPAESHERVVLEVLADSG